mmetsp:Transcript_84631/g.155131  ORF Transcript_84631/g.155131 Transcript_84631/m.155131 type:complete len:188 (-) Transcript_84631:108-671(-)
MNDVQASSRAPLLDDGSDCHLPERKQFPTCFVVLCVFGFALGALRVGPHFMSKASIQILPSAFGLHDEKGMVVNNRTQSPLEANYLGMQSETQLRQHEPAMYNRSIRSTSTTNAAQLGQHEAALFNRSIRSTLITNLNEAGSVCCAGVGWTAHDFCILDDFRTCCAGTGIGGENCNCGYRMGQLISC